MSIQKRTDRSMLRQMIQSWDIALLPWTYIRAIGIILFCALIATTSFYGYRWYRAKQNGIAQQIFAECMEEYHKAVTQSNEDRWEHVDALVKLGYEQNQHTDYGPYFLVLRSDIALAQSDLRQAIEYMQQALQNISKKVPVYDLYLTKLALMKMESPEHLSQGLQELEHIANDETNNNRDIALYYIGLYYWCQDNIEQAKTYWQKLVPLAVGEHASVWAVRAEQLMQQV